MPEHPIPRAPLRLLRVVLAVALGSISQVAAPILALLTLGAQEFGQFSLVYLLFAWGLSVQLSVCSEPYARTSIGRPALPAAVQQYRSVSTTVAAATTLVCGATGAVLWGDPLAALLAAVAAFTSVVRAGDRYRRVLSSGLTGPFWGDALFVAVFAATTAAAAATGLDGLLSTLAPWAAAGTTTCLVASHPRVARRGDLASWGRDHGSHVRPLLKESLVLDASSVGGAYLLLPFLSVAGFGVYRAVSNVATPVRLLTEALRPLASRPLGPRASRLLLVTLLALGVLTGVAAWVALAAVGHYGWELGVVDDLGPHRVATAVFVGSSLVGAMAYYRARVWGSAEQLWRGRLLQSGMALLGPLVGAYVAGLDGAVAGTAGATALGALVWLLLRPAQRAGRHPAPAAATPRPTGRS